MSWSLQKKFILFKENFSFIWVLSQCIVYWINFQNIVHSFTYTSYTFGACFYNYCKPTVCSLRGWRMGLNKSVKEDKFLIKIFFQTMLNEVLKFLWKMISDSIKAIASWWSLTVNESYKYNIFYVTSKIVRPINLPKFASISV